MKVVRTLFALLAALVLLLAALLTQLPLAPLGKSLVPPNLTVLEGSTVLRGRAVGVHAGGGSDVLRWHWCPGKGPLALCARLTGHSGFASAVARPRPGRLVLDDLTFSGVSTAALGIEDGALGGVLEGDLQRLVIPTGDCPLRRLRVGPGRILVDDLTLAGRPLSPHRLVVAPGRRGATLSVEGEQAQGELVLSRGDGRLTGKLRLDGDSGTGPLTMDLRLPCGWSSAAPGRG